MITLLIPTLNRSDFIERYLFYLRDNAFGGCVCIGDSSDNWHLERTRRIIKENKFSFGIIHRACPGLNLIQCIREILPLIKTPYAMYICDDDLVVPRTIARCIQFLEENPDYSAATGIAVHCFLESCGEEQKVAAVIEGRLNPVEDTNASQRLISLLEDYTVVGYAVSRSDQFKKRWPLDSVFSDICFSAELLPGCMQVAQGKLKKMEQIFVVRQIHQRHYIPMKDTIDWITNPDWAASFEVFRNCLAEELVKQDGIDITKAREIVKYAFWSRLNKMMTAKFQYLYQPDIAKSPLQEAKNALRRIPLVACYAAPLWQRCRRATQRYLNPNGINLEALMQSSSVYHEDFLPAHRAITDYGRITIQE